MSSAHRWQSMLNNPKFPFKSQENTMNLQLAQMLMETIYNRQTIYQKVMKDLTGSDLGKKFDQAVQNVSELIDGTYKYQSKHDRLAELDAIPVSSLVLEAMAAVCISNQPQPIQAVVSRMLPHLPYENPLDAAVTAGELLAVICKADMFDIIRAKNSETGSMMVHSRFTLEESTINSIEQTRYIPPMIIPPKHVSGKNNQDTSHLSFTTSLVLGAENTHKEKQSVDAINIANQVKLALDLDILEYEEISNKPLDTPKKLEQFTKMKKDSTQVYQEILDTGNEFYLTWKPDMRGRLYSQGYHINIQSTDYKKALINLVHKEVITLN